MDASTISAMHPPAVKVGGRRLSISSRPKHSTQTEPTTQTERTPGTPTDYPRPDNAHPPPPPHHEDRDEMPKKEKRHMNHETERHMRDMATRKQEGTMPSKNMMGGNKGFGAAGRIAQPKGRELGL